jgi:hypothetical protein
MVQVCQAKHITSVNDPFSALGRSVNPVELKGSETFDMGCALADANLLHSDQMLRARAISTHSCTMRGNSVITSSDFDD